MPKPIKKMVSQVYCTDDFVEKPRFNVVELTPELIQRAKELRGLAVSKKLVEIRDRFVKSVWDHSDSLFCDGMAAACLCVGQHNFWFCACLSEAPPMVTTERASFAEVDPFLESDESVLFIGFNEEELDEEERAIVDDLLGAPTTRH